MGQLSPLDARLTSLPTTEVSVDVGQVVGPTEMWRHALSQGGFGPEPLPEGVVEAVRALRPRRIRIFLHQFFDVYPERGQYDWSLLDPYMDALERTGAKVVACLTIKPPALFPTVDQRLWRPADVSEWQELVRALVRRYSTERGLVTHWEILNEPNLATGGGSPYTIPDPDDYFEFFQLTSAAVLEADSSVQVGGPAVSAGSGTEPLPGFVELCKKHGTRLDFVSWHLYSSDRAAHVDGVTNARRLVDGVEPAPELCYTEWNRSFQQTAPVVETDHDPAWASSAAAIAVALTDAGLDWSYFYRIWDRPIDPARHAPFTAPDLLARKVRNLNSGGRRLGMFDETGKPRPAYFTFQAMARLHDLRVAATTTDSGVVAYSTADTQGATMLIASDSFAGHVDRIVDLHVDGLPWRRVRYELCRIDDEKHWDPATLELTPIEGRTAWTHESALWSSLRLPAAALAVVKLTPLS